MANTTKDRKDSKKNYIPDHLTETSDLEHPTKRKFNRSIYRSNSMDEKQEKLLNEISHHKVVDPQDFRNDEDNDAGDLFDSWLEK